MILKTNDPIIPGTDAVIVENSHDLKIKMNAFKKDLVESQIPFFFAAYMDGEYKYMMLMPGEKELGGQYDDQMWRFKEFLETVVRFNKEDAHPLISTKEEE